MFNIDEHKEEYEAERRQREMEEVERREQERRAKIVRQRYDVLKPIANAIVFQHPNTSVVLDESTARLHVDGIEVGHLVDIFAERAHSYFHRQRGTGKLRLSVGRYGERVSYPQRKDGTFNVKAITEVLYYDAQRQRQRAMEDNVRKANEAQAKELRTELGVSEYAAPLSIRATSDVGKPVRLELSFQRIMTPTQARALHAALKAAGVL